jgi:formylglycine-generating enzyme required for sulfatase activity
VLIEGGEFVMGSEAEPDGVPLRYFGGLDRYGMESPPRAIQVEDYCIDAYEVTIDRYAACVLAGACDPDGCRWPDDPVPSPDDLVTVNHLPERCCGDPGLCPHHPVNCKTHAQAETYCRWIGRRLCTEAEWERAAKGPPPRAGRYPWGNESPDERRINTFTHGPGCLERVDSHSAGRSAEGVFNLIGNVYEWVAGGHHPRDPRPIWLADARSDVGRPEFRVARGGCFLTSDDQTATTRTILDPSFDWG